MLTYPESQHTRSGELVWVEQREFAAHMRFDGYERGRSAARFILKDINTGIKYPMFMADVTKLLQEAKHIQSGELVGVFMFCKRGSNYGLAWVGNAQVERSEGQL